MSFRPIDEPTHPVSGTASSPSKSTTSNPSGDIVEDRPQPSTTERSALLAAMTVRRTSNPSAESTTLNDMEYTGMEPLDFVLTLPKKHVRKWILMRLSNYNDLVREFAEEFTNARITNKSVADAEQQAVAQTFGMTRSIPHEVQILNLLFAENK